MERNYSIDFLKILFALSIACGHFKGSVLSSDLIVELFFILSGFFLVNSFYSGKYHGDPAAKFLPVGPSTTTRPPAIYSQP